MKELLRLPILVLFTFASLVAHGQAEPTNYPAGFTATTTSSSSISLTWTGSIGATLPSGYLIQVAVGSEAFAPLPVDGIAQTNDFDLSDDVGVVNVPHAVGANNYTFTAPTFSPVLAGTEYRFRIIPYNDGAVINYKIDGTPPTASAFTRSAEPDTHPGTFTGIGISITQIRLNFPDAATLTNTSGYIILGRTDGVTPAITGITDGVAPASLTFPAGTTLVATVASGATFTDHIGLTTASRYDYLIIPFNDDGSNAMTYNYKTDGTPRSAIAYTLSPEPTNQPATFTAQTFNTTRIDLTFPDAATLGNASGYIILRRQDGTNPTISGITDGVAPGSLSLPSGTTLVTTIPTGETAFDNTGLTAGTLYNYLILPFNYDGANNGTYNYKTDGTLRTANAATYSLEPSAHTNLFEALAVSATQVNLNFNSITTAGITNGSGFIILRRQDGTNPTATGITDGVAPGSLTLPAGTTLVTTINSTSTSTFSNTGLTTGTQYNYAIIPFNWNGSNTSTYNYYTAATIPVDNATPSAGPVIVSLNPADDGAAGLTLATATITFNVNVAKINGGPASDARTFRLYQVGNTTPIATIDKDNAGITGFGTATISIPFAANLTPNTQYYIQAGSNILKIAPNSTAWSGISDNTTWNFTAAATVVEPANPITLCYDGAFQTFGNIVIRESSTGDFSPGASQTYSLILPSGFVFNPAVTNAPLISGSNISAISSLTYTSGNTIVRFSYTITGTSGTLDQITVVGLQVKYTGAFTSTSGNIVRIGGTAVQNGNGETDAQNHGTLSFNPTFGEPTFTVEQLPGDPIVPANQTTFNASARPVKLIGNPAGGVFSGSGVIFSAANSGYIFDIPTVGVGTHPITYSYREPPATGTNQSCEVRKTITFNIITNWINGLLNSYCSTGPTSGGLSVSQSTIDQQFASKYGSAPGTFVFHEFVYWEPATSSFTTIPSPNATFNPTNAVYANTINQFRAVYIGYRAKIAATNTVLTDGPGDYFNINYIYIPVTLSPVLTFDLPGTVCVNEAALDLDALVFPPPTNNVTDNFSGTAVVSPTTNQWTFTPANVPNANTSPQNVTIRYNYTSTQTGCSNFIERTITVNPVPTAVPAASISPGTSLAVCQEGKPGTFNANVVPGTTYNWYTENPSSAYRASGNNFAPESYMSTATPVTFDFSVTRTINGCESPKLALTVVVNATPTTPGSSFSREYCVGEPIPNSDFTVTGSNIKWVNAITSQTLSVANPNQPTIQELGITNATPDKYSYIVSQAVSGCESQPISVAASVFALPTVTISSTSDLNRICKTGETISLNGIPAQGSWTGTASSALFNTNPVAGTTQLNPALLDSDPGTYTLQYNYTDNNSCSNSTTVSLQVLPTVQPSISIGTACFEVPVAFTNNSQLVPSGTGTTITATSWNFGDGSGLRLGNGPVESGTNNDRTSGTYFSPNHIFANVGTFQYTLTMVTSDGCVVNVPLQPITINQIPDVSFTWQNACVNSDPYTQFTATTSNIGETEMLYDWNFASENELTYSIISQTSNKRVSSLQYSVPGRDTVVLVATSIFNCSKTIQKPVFIVPNYTPIDENNAYVQNFNAGPDGWINGGVNSSWEFGQPKGKIIDRDSSATGEGNAWATELKGNYNASEKSWVLSGCFDFSSTVKPVIGLDIWADTPGGIDGAVLQYNIDGNIENDASWNVVGTVNAGINWYEQQGIASKPGNQAANDLGWSGNRNDGRYTSWKHAVFKLDNLIGEPNVVFRVAFASSTTISSNREGFAFDNIFIGERTRNVLIESFTNTSAAANSKNHNDQFKAIESTSAEVVKIQFHTSFPGNDVIHDLNKSMNNARVAQYGVTSSPALRIDGQFRTGDPFSWAQQVYDNQILQPSPISITLADPVKENGSVKLNATLRNITPNPVDLNGHNVFFVLVEKSITQSSLMGNNGDTEFVYVARQILPTASGIPLTEILAPGEELTISDIVWENNNLITPNANNAAIAVFVQSREAANQQVIQSRLYTHATAIPEPDIVTGVEDPMLAEKIQLYPVPANQTVHLLLPVPVLATTPLEVMDMQGRIMYSGTLASGEQQATLDVSGWANGIYLLTLKTGDTLVRKKILVMQSGSR